MIVPFADLEPALRFARELAVRRIGLAIAVLGPLYMAAFLSPDLALSAKLKSVLPAILASRTGSTWSPTGTAARPRSAWLKER